MVTNHVTPSPGMILQLPRPHTRTPNYPAPPWLPSSPPPAASSPPPPKSLRSRGPTLSPWQAAPPPKRLKGRRGGKPTGWRSGGQVTVDFFRCGWLEKDEEVVIVLILWLGNRWKKPHIFLVQPKNDWNWINMTNYWLIVRVAKKSHTNLLKSCKSSNFIIEYDLMNCSKRDGNKKIQKGCCQVIFIQNCWWHYWKGIPFSIAPLQDQ